MLDLPSLVLDHIFSYLTVQDVWKCKQVCRRWKEEIELRDSARDSLVLHIGYFPMNRSWLRSLKLMRVSNSIELKSLAILKAASTKCYLKKNLGNLRRVQIVNTYTVFNNRIIRKFHLCLAAFEQIEELELDGLSFEDDLVIKLPRLKSFALRKIEGDRLELDCPLLERLILNSQFKKCSNKHPEKLNHLECADRNYLFALKTKLKNLEYLNFYDENCNVKHNLLKYLPKLKKLVLYTDDGWKELEKLERQKQTYGLNDLQILICGFEGEPVRFLMSQATFGLHDDLHINELFVNYARLVELVHYDVSIDYGLLFKRFRILPSNFFAKFPRIDSVVISEVTSFTHLFGFLKHCSRMEHLTIRLSKIRHNIQFLDQLPILAPTLRVLTIEDDQPFALFDYDYTFLFSLRVILVRLKCTALPAAFFELAYRRCKYLLGFQQLHGNNHTSVMITKHNDKPDSFGLLTNYGIMEIIETFDKLIEFMRGSRFVSSFVTEGHYV